MSDAYDLVVIGGGSAGYAGASTAARLGLRTAVLEGGEMVGGLCILRGCMPSKTLLESAARAETIRRASDFGLRAEYKGADGSAIVARKRRLIEEFAGYRRTQLETGKFEFVRGRAQFVDPHTVEIDLLHGGTRRVTGRAFLLAAGSHVNRLEIPGLAETGYWTSDEVLDSERIPRSVVILGGGAIGLECASYYAGIGVETTVIQRGPQILRETDGDVAEALTCALERRGIRVCRNTSLSHVQRQGELKRVCFDHAGTVQIAEAEEIVYALGRKPNIENLGLDRAGVVIEKHAPRTSRAQQCEPPHIFAAGDICGPFEVVHVAIEQGEIAARNVARFLRGDGDPLEQIDYTLKLFVVFTHPEAATIGLNEREAADQDIEFTVAKYPFMDHGKAMVLGETEGFVKLIADRQNRSIIGAAAVGPSASELIHEIAVAMHFKATAADLLRVPHYHPTLSEIWTYPAEELAK